MSMPIRAAVLFACLVACLPAQAQYLLGLETNVELTKQDLAIIRHTVHGKPVGTTAKWNNPESRNFGKVTLLKKFTRNGQKCETLDYRLTTQGKGPEHHTLSSCLQPNGHWRLI